MKRQQWFDALTAGATAGLVAEVLVLRMNPEVTQTVRGVLVGMPLWASWGTVMVGLPVLLGLAVLERVRPAPDRWAAPFLQMMTFLVAVVLTAVNARRHAQLLSGPAHRMLVQDAVAWGVALMMAAAGAWLVRRVSHRHVWRIAFSLVMVMLPVIRVLTSPTPPRQYLEVEAEPLGVPERRLLVVGLEGLDAKVLLVDAASASHPNLTRLREEGVRAPITPHRPYLRWALWTSVATGTYPGRHGVKAHLGWNLPLVFDETLRLLPWTPEGSRMILPWGLSEQVPPPVATVAPLWARLEVSGVSTVVIGWPGSWGDDPSVCEVPTQSDGSTLDPSMRASLDAALEPFPERRGQIWSAFERDQARAEMAVASLTRGVEDVWVHLESLAVARRYHEPLRPGHTRERLFLELVMELVDDQLGSLLAVTDDRTLVAVVSPFGLAPPDWFERMKRLFGGGESWHTSAESSPEGLLILLGDGVDRGARVQPVRPPDVAPTLCYLLGLPVAQYMEGSVVVGAITPSFLAEHPLRVVE